MAQQKKKTKKAASSGAAGSRKSAAKQPSAAAKKPAAAAKKTAAKPQPVKEVRAETGTPVSGEVLLLLAGALCVLLLLGNMNLGGSFGRMLRRFQLGAFGTLGYAFPFYIFWISCFSYINGKRLPGNTALKAAASAIAYVSACGLLELVGGRSFGSVMTLRDYYAHGGETLGGGWFGGFFYTELYPLIGVMGTYVVLIAILIISFVTATGKSLIRPLQERGGRFMEDAREERALRREEEELRRRERALVREERRRELEVKRTELHARSLAFGEDTRLMPEEDPREAARRGGNAGRKEPVPGRRYTGWRRETAEEIAAREAAADSRRPEEIRRDYLPKKVRKTLAELEELDPGKPELSTWDETDPVKKQEAEPAPVFEPVIHMGTEPAPQTEKAHEEPETREAVPEIHIPAAAAAPQEEAPGRDLDISPWIRERKTTGRKTAEEPVRPTPRVQEAPAGESGEELTVRPCAVPEEAAAGPAEGPAAPADIPAAAEQEAPPASAEVSIEDSMAGYDEFAPAPIPSEWEREPAAAGGSRKSRGSAKKSLKEESIWRTGEAADGTSGVTFTSQTPVVKPEEPVIRKEYQFPPMSLLKQGSRVSGASAEQLKATAAKLQQTLRDFGVGVTVTDISCGPAITRYELQPDQGVKVSRIVGLQDDIKLNLAASDIRIEAPIPGKAAVGIEVPNKESQTVFLRDLLDSNEFRKSASRISFGVGKDIGGSVIVSDLARMPHLLIAGATGSGKSVCINTIIMSILYKAHPDEVKLIMIDPKVVELSVYNGIPHLMIPVVTDAKKAAGALNWAVAEMNDRYNRFAEQGVRDIKGYNQKIREMEDPDRKPLPQIVVIVDEMADLMMVAKAEVEEAICRLAQLARAAGIHLVLATQRPSVDVITGLIKANVQSRIAFAVSSGTDSRTILDMVGAEKLLGKGDMLFYPSNYPKPVRVQGAFVSDEEVQSVVDFLSAQTETPLSNRALEQKMEESAKDAGTVGAGERDELFEKAGKFIIEKDKASIGNLQRVFRIGFNRAARIMDQLSDYGVVGPDEGTKAREILMDMPQFEELIRQLYG